MYVDYIFHDLYYILGSAVPATSGSTLPFFFQGYIPGANSPWFFRHKSSPEAPGVIKLEGKKSRNSRNVGWSLAVFSSISGEDFPKLFRCAADFVEALVLQPFRGRPKRAGHIIIEVNEGKLPARHVAGGYQNVLIISNYRIYQDI